MVPASPRLHLDEDCTSDEFIHESLLRRRQLVCRLARRLVEFNAGGLWGYPVGALLLQGRLS